MSHSNKTAKPRLLAALFVLAVLGWTSTARAEETPLRLRCGLTGALALWIAPSDTAFELAADCGLRWPIFSISVELRGSPPAGAQLPLGPPPPGSYQPWTKDDAVYVSTWRLVAAAVPAVHWQLSEQWNRPTLLVGVVVQGGGVFGSGLGLEGDPAMANMAAGARLAFEVDIISDRLSVRAGADFLGVIVRPVLSVVDREAWPARPYSMAIGGGLGVFF